MCIVGSTKKSSYKPLCVFWILDFPSWEAFNLIAKMKENELFIWNNSMASFLMHFVPWKCCFFCDSLSTYFGGLVHSCPLECYGERVNTSFYILSRSSRKLLTFESHRMQWQEEIAKEWKGTSLLLLIQFFNSQSWLTENTLRYLVVRPLTYVCEPEHLTVLIS